MTTIHDFLDTPHTTTGLRAGVVSNTGFHNVANSAPKPREVNAGTIISNAGVKDGSDEPIFSGIIACSCSMTAIHDCLDDAATGEEFETCVQVITGLTDGSNVPP